jgi:endoglucanase
VFGLMNEPHGLPTEQWLSAANAAIAAIRDVGATQLILVPGNAWTGGHSWLASWYGTPNGTVMVDVVDPVDNFAFEIHQYVDSDSSGTHAECKSATAGSEALAGVTQWMRDHGHRAFLGELGAADNATCQSAITDQLAYMKANQDVWFGFAWWAAGPWWGDYMFSIEPEGLPDNPQDKPQLAWLAPFF